MALAEERNDEDHPGKGRVDDPDCTRGEGAPELRNEGTEGTSNSDRERALPWPSLADPVERPSAVRARGSKVAKRREREVQRIHWQQRRDTYLLPACSRLAFHPLFWSTRAATSRGGSASMVLCVGYMGRFGATGLRASRPVLGTSQLRSLSTVGLQRSRFILAQNELRSLQFRSGPRSFWSWAKSAPAPAAASSSPLPVSTQAAAEEPSPVIEAATASSSESPAPAEASTATDAASTVPTPDVALSPEAVPTEVLPIDPTLIPALNYGDLAALGLAGWTPPGICRWTMELINVSAGLPWIWTIVATTVLSRVVLFPFTVKSMRGTAALAPYQGDIAAIRDEMAAAQKKKDTLAMQRAALKQKMIYEKAGVGVVGMAISPFVQLPVTLGMFFGVKSLCDLPLEQLKWSGLVWLPDLTIADPTWTLPILATLLMNVQISVSTRDMVGTTVQMGHVMNLFRVLTAASVFVLANLSNGVLVYLLTSMTCMTAQSLLLRHPAVRRMLGIPIVPKNLRMQLPTMRESAAYLRQWWNNKMADARAAQRASRRR
ncbi:transporter [Ganoderma sinense ZZ0214-1]|uniref:Transporter n=1 Tax=Ganoderma sinense ZZ0214-1 TaxID=1077348 RepID=A0A2G8RWF5_9APHY|nr:transporter [Ganoderma sinense ZZ0214-1]